jgi:spermidine synthase
MDLVREHLPLGRARGRIRVRIADAREVLGSVPPGRFDVVISDVFAGARTPPHLTTVECAQLAARAVAPGGLYIQNVADGPPLSFAKQQAATVAQVFTHQLLVAEPGVLRRRRFGNLVLAGSQTGLPADELRRRAAADAFAARVLDGEDLDRFVAGTRPVTDTTAQPSPMPPPAVLSGPDRS